MSFLPVCGKIYICSECEGHTQVLYDGGAQITQIGDDNIAELLNISEEIGQPNTDPDNDGYFLFDIIICSNCYEEINHETRKTMENIHSRTNHLISERAELVNTLSDDFIEINANNIESMDINSVCEIFPDITSEIGDKRDSPKKQKGKINKFVRSDKNKNIVKKAILEKIFRKPSTNDIISSYNTQVEDYIEFMSQLNSDVLFYVHKRNIRDSENLNNYIQSPETTRNPSSDTKSMEVFNLNSIEVEQFENMLISDDYFDGFFEEEIDMENLDIDSITSDYILKAVNLVSQRE